MSHRYSPLVTPNVSCVVGRAVGAAVLLVISAVQGNAQDVDPPSSGPFSFVQQLTGIAPPTPLSRFRISIRGNTAVVGADDVAHVFERGVGSAPDDWNEVATLLAGEGSAGDRFGSAVAVSGDLAAVLGSQAVLIFERHRGGPNAWGEMARVDTSDPGVELAEVALDGDTLAIAASFPAGSVYVFDRHHTGQDAWGETAKLAGHDIPSRLFGSALALQGNTLLVAAAELTHINPVFVFERSASGAWNETGTLSAVEGETLDSFGFGQAVSLDGNTAIVGSGEFIGNINVFERQGSGTGTSRWKLTQVLRVDQSGPVGVVAAISGDFIAYVSPGSLFPPHVLFVFARNQGGSNEWGKVGEFTFASSSTTVGVAIDHGTVAALRVPGSGSEDPPAAFVFDSDIDGDGVRDAADACPRDPLNRVLRRCRRSRARSPIVEQSLSLSDMHTSVQGRLFIAAATLRNVGQAGIRNPFFDVVVLSGGNGLLNADGGGIQGAGATLSADVGDGVWSPGETVTVRFLVWLRARRPFQFHVDVRGDPLQ